MKSKLLTLLFVVAAALGGYWLGSYRTSKGWERIAEARVQSRAHTEAKNSAQVNLMILDYLHAAKQSEASDMLERHLDVALIKCAAYWTRLPPDQRDGWDMMILRNARDYRSRHPWTNSSPEFFERVQKAFSLAD